MFKQIQMDYGSTLYQVGTLRKAVTAYTKTLNHLLLFDKSITGLVSTGSSGSILASAMMMKRLTRPLYHLHVNKPGTNSHNGRFSGWPYEPEGVYVFVDDFIDEGKSLKRCIKYFSSTIIKYALVSFTNTDTNNVANVANVACILAGYDVELIQKAIKERKARENSG